MVSDCEVIRRLHSNCAAGRWRMSATVSTSRDATYSRSIGRALVEDPLLATVGVRPRPYTKPVGCRDTSHLPSFRVRLNHSVLGVEQLQSCLSRLLFLCNAQPSTSALSAIIWIWTDSSIRKYSKPGKPNHIVNWRELRLTAVAGFSGSRIQPLYFASWLKEFRCDWWTERVLLIPGNVPELVLRALKIKGMLAVRQDAREFWWSCSSSGRWLLRFRVEQGSKRYDRFLKSMIYLLLHHL